MQYLKYSILCLILSAAVFSISADAQGTTPPEDSLVIHFGSGKTYLSASNKDALRVFFNTYDIGSRSRVFVVGYTDAVGDKRRNLQLSRKRAQSVRRQIISAFGLAPSVIMATGKGEQNPVGDNREASGRAANRRAEIYLVNAEVRKSVRKNGPGDPYFSAIDSLILEAKTMIKQRQLGEAVKKLKEARGLGGDFYSDWHCAYGLAGFYANAPDTEISAHLNTALRLDPYNYLAREYLGRVTARRKLARGEVSARMGRSADQAIPVTSVAQQHEYLRLFNVEPQAHRQLDGRPLDVWECTDADGIRVVYYFDHSNIYRWAYGGGTTPPGQAQAAPAKAATVTPENRARKVPPTPDRSKDDPTVEILGLEKAKKVWESKLFD